MIPLTDERFSKLRSFQTFRRSYERDFVSYVALSQPCMPKLKVEFNYCFNYSIIQVKVGGDLEGRGGGGIGGGVRVRGETGKRKKEQTSMCSSSSPPAFKILRVIPHARLFFLPLSYFIPVSPNTPSPSPSHLYPHHHPSRSLPTFT